MRLFNFPGEGYKTVEVPHGLEHFTGDLNMGISALHKVEFKNGGKGHIFVCDIYSYTGAARPVWRCTGHSLLRGKVQGDS